jgi:CheY-like chemotaxis protein
VGINKQKNRTPKIMVIDDERDILRILKRDLESNSLDTKFSVDAYSDSESALKAFANRRDDYYDLVLTDIRMSKMTGFELYHRLKKRNLSIKIVFFTAFEIDKLEYAQILPDAHFIHKPLSISNLIRKLNLILSLN